MSDVKLTSIDMFSGFGGMSHALRGFVSPLAYCEDDPVCRATLDARIAAGDLEDATVLSDFRDTQAVTSAVAGTQVDLITVGAKCSSPALIAETLNFVKMVRPPMVFLENSRIILTTNDGKDYRSILRTFSRLGYRVTWCVLSGEHVGAWHHRQTWFALAYRQNTLHGKSIRSSIRFTKFRWSKMTRPNRTLGQGQKICNRETDVLHDNKRRLNLLSDAVVPDCTRLGFMYLFTGGIVTNTRQRMLRHMQFAPQQETANTRGRVSIPAFGISSRLGTISAHEAGPLLFRPPRIRCRTMPHFHSKMDARFVEFIMGFPKNWTSMRMAIHQGRDA